MLLCSSTKTNVNKKRPTLRRRSHPDLFQGNVEERPAHREKEVALAKEMEKGTRDVSAVKNCPTRFVQIRVGDRLKSGILPCGT